MKKRLLTLLVSFFVSFVFAETPAGTNDTAATAPQPQTTLQPEPQYSGDAATIRKEMNHLFEESKKVNSADAGERTRVRKLIDQSFDWEKISQLCLGSVRWKKESGANRDQFQKLLKDVIQKTAYSRLEKFWQGLQYRFAKIEITGNNAQMTAEFLKDSEIFTLDYKLNKKNNRWLIYNLSFEGEDYAANINQQVMGFLQKNSFSAFLEKLKKRRDELTSDAAEATKQG